MGCIFCNCEKKDIVYETKNFYVKVGRGIITAGHVMIIPKKHYSAIAEIGKELVNEYLNLKKDVIEEISLKFFKPFLMEHGAFLQSVFHAHIHLIPVNGNGYSNADLLHDMIIPSSKKLNFKIIKINNFSELREYFLKYKKYLYYENNNEQYIIEATDILKNNCEMVVYRSYFQKLGLKGVSDWQTMTEKDKKNDKIKITETINKLFK